MRVRLLAALLAAAAIAVPAAQSGSSPIVVKGFAWIGAFQVTGSGPASARRAFGKPTAQHETSSDCTLDWPGLRISFYTLAHDRQCKDWSAFGVATITRPWVTDRGLRQGDPVSRAKALYAAARKPGGSSKQIGLLIKFSPAIGDYGLYAEVKNGHVTNLIIEDPQGGE